ncbi:hypothetical protein ACTXT7_009821 [Hymenolepis weldensis]
MAKKRCTSKSSIIIIKCFVGAVCSNGLLVDAKISNLAFSRAQTNKKDTDEINPIRRGGWRYPQLVNSDDALLPSSDELEPVQMNTELQSNKQSELSVLWVCLLLNNVDRLLCRRSPTLAEAKKERGRRNDNPGHSKMILAESNMFLIFPIARASEGNMSFEFPMQ